MMKPILILLIKGYQLVLSPLFPRSCRFYPSCSQYAVEALSKYGLRHGLWKATVRLAKCHPFSSGGYDPLL